MCWAGATQSFPFCRLCSEARLFSGAVSSLSCCWFVGRWVRLFCRSSFCPGSWASHLGPSGRCWELHRQPVCRTREWLDCQDKKEKNYYGWHVCVGSRFLLVIVQYTKFRLVIDVYSRSQDAFLYYNSIRIIVLHYITKPLLVQLEVPNSIYP